MAQIILYSEYMVGFLTLISQELRSTGKMFCMIVMFHWTSTEHECTDVLLPVLFHGGESSFNSNTGEYMPLISQTATISLGDKHAFAMNEFDHLFIVM